MEKIEGTSIAGHLKELAQDLIHALDHLNDPEDSGVEFGESRMGRLFVAAGHLGSCAGGFAAHLISQVGGPPAKGSTLALLAEEAGQYCRQFDELSARVGIDPVSGQEVDDSLRVASELLSRISGRH